MTFDCLISGNDLISEYSKLIVKRDLELDCATGSHNTDFVCDIVSKCGNVSGGVTLRGNDFWTDSTCLNPRYSHHSQENHLSNNYTSWAVVWVQQQHLSRATQYLQGWFALFSPSLGIVLDIPEKSQGLLWSASPGRTIVFPLGSSKGCWHRALHTKKFDFRPLAFYSTRSNKIQ